MSLIYYFSGQRGQAMWRAYILKGIRTSLFLIYRYILVAASLATTSEKHWDSKAINLSVGRRLWNAAPARP